METDFEAADNLTRYARRFVHQKLSSQQDLAESVHLSEALQQLYDHMADTVSVCESLERQLATKRGQFFRRYCAPSIATDK